MRFEIIGLYIAFNAFMLSSRVCIFWCSLHLKLVQEKMRAQQSKFLESFNSSKDDEMEDANPEQEVCDSEVSNDTQESALVTCSLCRDSKSKNPVSYMVLLQVSECF